MRCLPPCNQGAELKTISCCILVGFNTAQFDRYFVPEYLHRNLKYWYTPDIFEAQGFGDNASVTVWQNIANICYQGHWSSDCSQSKILNSSTLSPEVLTQRIASQKPVYKRKALNGFGVVKFSRTAHDGSAGQFLQIESNSSSSIAGFSAGSNPFQTENGFTIFLVVRTVQGASDSGVFGILNLVTDQNNLKGLSIFKSAVSCLNNSSLSGFDCSGSNCKVCAAGANTTTFGTFNAIFGSRPTIEDNSCTSVCTAGCDPANPPQACKSLWGPSYSQSLQEADNWHVLTLSAYQGTFSGYIDGSHASTQPPMKVANEISAAISLMRIGLMDNGTSSAAGFASMELAEMMVYDSHLTVQEMDRIGNYLANKFGLRTFRLNYDVGSSTRSAAVSKGCGCTVPGALWSPLCNTLFGMAIIKCITSISTHLIFVTQARTACRECRWDRLRLC